MNELRAQAQQLDKQDTLSHKKEAFDLPKGLIYLDGNSLGPLTHAAKKRAVDVVNEQWGNSLIASWNSHKWIELPMIIGNKIAPLIGATANTVVCCDSISVNLFKLLSAALMAQKSAYSDSQKSATAKSLPKRAVILSQNDNFPTDLYMAQGLSMLLGEQECNLLSVDSDAIESTLLERGQEIAVLMLTHVNFRNGDIHDMQRLTKLAHAQGVLVLWDLAHSAGVLPIDLQACDVDYAVGCTYKYLNGGPGAPAFAYVAPKHITTLQQPLSGWMGHKQPFAFAHDYESSETVERLLAGTPSIISMSILDAALDVFEDINMTELRDKSIALNAYFGECVAALVTEEDFVLACKPNAQHRGSQISYQHPHAYAICQALIDRQVVADFRAPNILRLGFSPLFLSFENVFEAASILQQVMQERSYMQAKYSVKQAVT